MPERPKRGTQKKTDPKNPQKPRNMPVWIFLVIIGVIFLLQLVMNFSPENKIPYSDFKQLVLQDRVADVTLYPEKILGKLDDGSAFTTVPIADMGLVETMDQHEVKYRGVKENKFSQFLFTWIVPIGIMIMIWIFITRQMDKTGSSVLSFGKNRAKIFAEKDTCTNFKDVAGCKEAKEELEEIIEYLKTPEKFQSLGGKIPRGVLLVGMPGTGKTLLARAVAGEANVPFFSISGSDFVEMFVGVGASRVRDLFVQAKAKAPCIVFIDEIDAVGRQRGAGLGGGHDEREQTLNQLLVEMDGFEVNSSVIVIAATNRPDVLDAALLRPGRFDRQVVIDSPGMKDRKEILQVHMRGKPIDKDVCIDMLAQRSPGFTGADIANAVNEAALLAARKNKKKIDMDDFKEAMERVITGPERKSKVINEKEKKIIAYHEAGHALVCYNCKNTDPVHKISIVPRGFGALGFMLHLPTEDRFLNTRQELLERLQITMGGRVSEEITFGEITNGAQNDIEQATTIAHKMVCQWGMSDKLGPLMYGSSDHEVFLGRYITQEKSNLSDTTSNEIDKEVKRLVHEAYETAKHIISTNSDKLEAIASLLLDKEVIEKEEFYAMMQDKPIEETVSDTAEPSDTETAPVKKPKKSAKKPPPDTPETTV